VPRALRSGSRADTVLLVACALASFIATVLPQQQRETIASILRQTALAPLLELQRQAERARVAFVQRDESMIRLDSLALRSARLTDITRENENLRRLLGLGSRLQWGFVVAEALRDPGRPDETTLLLTVGADAGVREGSPVVSPDGIIGQVTSVESDQSLAVSLMNPLFRASAMAADGSAFGIVRPRGRVRDEPERYLLEMHGVSFGADLKPGTVITSSGLGGIFPRGLPIGTVIGELKTTEPWSRTYIVRPAVRPEDITSVIVLKPERASSDVASVWKSAASADSAVRRINAAGDSIVRRAELEAAAQKRVIDSIAAAQAARQAPPPNAADTSRAQTRPPAAPGPARRDTVRRRP
jgi:rod shape-determining protein MreC